MAPGQFDAASGAVRRHEVGSSTPRGSELEPDLVAGFDPPFGRPPAIDLQYVLAPPGVRLGVAVLVGTRFGGLVDRRDRAVGGDEDDVEAERHVPHHVAVLAGAVVDEQHSAVLGEPLGPAQAEIPLDERVGHRRLDGSEFHPRRPVDDGHVRPLVVARPGRRVVTVAEQRADDPDREGDQPDRTDDGDREEAVDDPPGVHTPDGGDGHA